MKEVMNNHWSDNLRRRMENYQEQPPEGLWNNIENSMKSSAKHNKIMLWSKRVCAAAAVIAILLFIGYRISDRKAENMPIAQQIQKQDNAGQDHLSESEIDKDAMIKHDNRSSVNNPLLSQTLTLTESKNDTTKENLNEHPEIVNNLTEDISVESKKEENKDGVLSKVPIKHKVGPESDSEKKSKPQNKDTFVKSSKNKIARWATNIYASNISFRFDDQYDGYGNVLADESNEIVGGDIENSSYEDILLQNKEKETYTKVKHRQPITMGVSVNYNLNHRWSLTSGLTYTLLRSRLHSGSNEHYFHKEQTLHDIGIPLNVNYTLFTAGKISLYASAGGMIEKNVYRKMSTDYILDNDVKSTKNESGHLDKIQWSVKSSLGLIYNITKTIGVYAEPGIGYYFKNGSEVETIYKEKPLNLSLHVGLRLLTGK